jgi:hypothetical protein
VGEGPFLPPVVAGSLFVALFFTVGAVLAAPPGVVRTIALFFSLLGASLVFGLTTIGSGAALLSRFGSRAAEPEGPATPESASAGVPPSGAGMGGGPVLTPPAAGA